MELIYSNVRLPTKDGAGYMSLEPDFHKTTFCCYYQKQMFREYGIDDLTHEILTDKDENRNFISLGCASGNRLFDTIDKGEVRYCMFCGDKIELKFKK